MISLALALTLPGMLILNIGGEGEVPGAINVNTFHALRRPYGEIITQGPFIGGDFMRLPIRSASVDLVVGNMLPLVGSMADDVLREAFRVLKSDRSFRAFASSGGGVILLAPAKAAGFASVSLAGGFATGVKP